MSDEVPGPYEQLRNLRDELMEAAAADVDVYAVIAEEASEIDNGLAEELHGLVSVHVEQVAGRLADLDGARELALLAAVRFPDEPEPARRARAGSSAIPQEPQDVADPSAVVRRDPDPDEDETEGDVDVEYQDALRDAHDSAVLDRAMHVRRICRYAEEFVGGIRGVAETGDTAAVEAELAERDALLVALSRAFAAWEATLAVKGDGPDGPGEWELAAERWLADVRRDG